MSRRPASSKGTYFTCWGAAPPARDAHEELAGLRLGSGHDQRRDVHRITTDVARARDLAGDANRQPGRAERHEHAVLVVEEEIEVAGRAAGLLTWRSDR